MNFKILACGLLILSMALSASCSTVTPPAPVSEKSESVSLAESFRERAEKCEERNEWFMAREFLKVSRQLTPREENMTDGEKIDALTRKIQEESDRFYLSGVGYYEKGNSQKSARAFLEVLRINPEHEGAISYMTDKLQNADRKFFEATRDTDLATVAEQVYGDPEKHCFIAYFNDMEKSAVVEAGRILFLPTIPRNWGRIASKTPFDVEKSLKTARERLEAEQYEDAIETAAKIRKHDPENARAADIQNEAWLQIARHYEAYEKYPEALHAMSNVDPDYEPAQSYMAHLQKIVKALAEQHYKKGVQHFVDEMLEKAIAEWEKTLALDPNNQKAREDIENAKRLLEKLGKIK